MVKKQTGKSQKPSRDQGAKQKAAAKGQAAGQGKPRRRGGGGGQQMLPATLTGVGDDELIAEWVRECERKLIRFVDAPIPSLAASVSGSIAPGKPVMILSSSKSLIGETRDDSLDSLCMRVFASAQMMGPIGRNNELPDAPAGKAAKGAKGQRELVIYTDASRKDGSIGISAVFMPDEDEAYAYAGALLVDTQLDARIDGIANGYEDMAAAAALLTAISHGYRRIRLLTDCKEAVRVWNGEQRPRRTMDKQLVTLRDVIARRKGHVVAMEHVYGHRSDLMNIAADGAAQINSHMSRNESTPVPTPAQEAAPAQGQQPQQQGQQGGRRRRNGTYEAQAQAARQQRPQQPQQGQQGDAPAPDAHADAAGGQPQQDAQQAAQPRRRRRGRQGRQDGQAQRQDAQGQQGQPQQPPAPAGGDMGGGNGIAPEAGPAPDRGADAQPVAPLNAEVTALCEEVGASEEGVSAARVARHMRGGGYERWDGVDGDPALASLIRALMCDGQPPQVTDDEKLRLWSVVSPGIARKLPRTRKLELRTLRALLVARICNVGVMRCVDAASAGRA